MAQSLNVNRVATLYLGKILRNALLALILCLFTLWAGAGVLAQAPTITGFTPKSGNVGASVTISGTNFTGATSVKFNGFAATTFSVTSATTITATVPISASKGPISVTLPSGHASSTTDFTVVPRFQVLSPKNGNVLSGTVSVFVLLSDESDGGDIHMYVDGADYGTSNADAHSDDTRQLRFPIDTTSLSNGAHKIRVTGSNRLAYTINITTNNSINSVKYTPHSDPAGASSKSIACHITANLAVSQPWQVKINDLNGNAVKSFSGNGTAIDVVWDGTNSLGVQAADNLYLIVIAVSKTGTHIDNPISK